MECNSLKVVAKFEADSMAKIGKKRGVIKEDQAGNKAEEEYERIEMSPSSSTRPAAAMAPESGLVGWDDEENWWPSLSGTVDEQMSWGSFWLPFWDVEFMQGEALNMLVGDVIWDDDIWGIRGIKEVPNP